MKNIFFSLLILKFTSLRIKKNHTKIDCNKNFSELISWLYAIWCTLNLIWVIKEKFSFYFAYIAHCSLLVACTTKLQRNLFVNKYVYIIEHTEYFFFYYFSLVEDEKNSFFLVLKKFSVFHKVSCNFRSF